MLILCSLNLDVSISFCLNLLEKDGHLTSDFLQSIFIVDIQCRALMTLLHLNVNVVEEINTLVLNVLYTSFPHLRYHDIILGGACLSADVHYDNYGYG